MNLLLAITRKRKFKLWILMICDFVFSITVIEFILNNNYIYLKKIFETNQLIGFILFWILLSYVRGRYLLTNLDNIILKSIKDIKEIIIVSSIVLIFTFILKTIHLQDLFTSKNILLIYCILIPVSLINQLIFYFLFENKKAKIIDIFLIGDVQEIKYIKENLILDKYNIYNFRKIDSKKDINFIPNHLIVSSKAEMNVENQEIIEQMYKNGVEIYSSITWCEKFIKRIPTELINIYESINNQNSQNEKNIQIRLKRLGDITLGFTILIISLPIIIIAGFFIWLNDNGPIFYTQTREGLFGKRIKIVKLRTMKIDAEKKGVQWSIKGDKRITSIGSVLRKMRIDELPQILAVIKGDMSLIGPRPERPEFNIKLNELIPNYYLRSHVKPGLSGWAQVNYPYGASVADSKNKLSYDFYYMRNFSCWIDFLILFKTIRIVFSGIGSTPNN